MNPVPSGAFAGGLNSPRPFTYVGDLQLGLMLVGALCAAQVVGWTLAPTLANDALPPDVLEGYMWGREWVLGTYKHPALPSWGLETSRILTGAVGWPAYLVAQIFVAATFVFVFLLGRDLLGTARGAAGTLLLTGVTYYASYSVIFNHNIAQAVFWAALPWALWRAVHDGRVFWWVLVGALAAAGLYAKLWFALLLLSLAGWMLWSPGARRCLATPGPWIGLGVFVAGVTPLMVWLLAYDFAPLRYAAKRGTGGTALFLANTALNLVGLPLMLAVAGLLAVRWRPGDKLARVLAGAERPSTTDPVLQYLMVVALGPVTFATLGALAGGFKMKYTWGIPMFSHLGLLAMALLPGWLDRDRLQWIARSAAAVLVAGPLGYASTKGADWPQSAIAARMGEIWARETGNLPMRIVAGNYWTAGIVGATAESRPSAFTDGSFNEAPWITLQRIESQGMLVVWKRNALPPGLEPWVAGRTIGHEEFVANSQRRGRLLLDYVIVAPKAQRSTNIGGGVSSDPAGLTPLLRPPL
jgi:4-amino-4-deoxy-L-arabinose transferase-like glycosyltransferase